MYSLCFQKSEKIRTPQEYRRIMGDRYKKITTNFVLLASPAKQRRVGIIVSKRVHKSAVRRNHAKRRIREAYRQIPELLGVERASLWHAQTWPQWELVIIARKGMLVADFEMLRSDLIGGILQLTGWIQSDQRQISQKQKAVQHSAVALFPADSVRKYATKTLAVHKT